MSIHTIYLHGTAAQRVSSRREAYSYYMNVEVQEPYITLENFTRFDDVPASEWGKSSDYMLQGAVGDDLEPEILEYGLW